MSALRFASALLLALLALTAAPTLSSAQVVLVPFNGRNSVDARNAVADALAERGVEVVPLDLVEQARGENGDDPAALASALGASAVVVATIGRRGGQHRAEATVFDRDGQELTTITTRGRRISGLARGLARRIANQVDGLPPATGGAAAGNSGGGSSGPVAQQRRVVVLDIDGPGGTGTRTRVIRALESLNYDVVPRNEFEAGADTVDADLETEAGVVQASRESQVDAVVRGTNTRRGRRYRSELEVLNGSTGAVVGTGSFRGRSARSLNTSVARGLQVELQSSIDSSQRPVAAQSSSSGNDGGTGGFAFETVEEEGDDEPSPYDDGEDLFPALDIALYGRVFSRKLTYNDDLFGLLRGYSLALGPAFGINGSWFPAAHFTKNFAAHIGIDGMFERAFAIDSRRRRPDAVPGEGDAEIFPTRSQTWYVGLRGRYPVGDHFFSAFGGFGGHDFVVQPSGPSVPGTDNTPQIPKVNYRYVRLGLSARLAVAGGLYVAVRGAYRILTSLGGIGDTIWFPRASAGAADAEFEVGYRVFDGLEIRVSVDWRRYWYTMNPVLGDAWIAGGAVDQYFGGTLGVAWRR